MAARIRWGILSTANIAVKRFIPGAIASHNGVVAAIASRDRARAEVVAERFGIPRVHDDYAADAGKPILCEKPLAIDAVQARRVVDRCHERGVPLMEAFMYRLHPQHARVRELVAGGEIGELRLMRASFNFMLEPFDPNNVRLKGELAGGALMDVGCYTINAARMHFGEEPAWVSAQSDFREAFGVDVATAGVLGFSGGRMATFDCGFRAAGKGSYALGGTRGSIDVLDAFVPEPLAGEVSLLVNGTGGRREERVAPVDQYRLEAEAFADMLLHGTPLPYAADDAVANMRVIDALHASAASSGARALVSPG